MTGYIKEPHTAIFTGQTGGGKTHLVLESIEKEYNKYFDFITGQEKLGARSCRTPVVHLK